MNKNNLSTEEIQKIQMDILDKIDLICEKHNLKYSLCGGSLIGAIRHNGFIPWDDDIDIMMLRDDYNNLYEIIKNSKIDGLELLSMNNNDYYYPYMKMVDLSTSAKEINTYRINNYGVFVDIFPIDIVPKNPSKRIKQKKQLDKLVILNQIAFHEKQISNNFIKLLIKRTASILCKLYGFKRFVKKMDNLSKKYNNSDKSEEYGYNMIFENNSNCYDLDFFTKLKKIKFNDRKYYIIEEYDKYLRDVYGDYMELPSVDKRVPGHCFEYIYRK